LIPVAGSVKPTPRKRGGACQLHGTIGVALTASLAAAPGHLVLGNAVMSALPFKPKPARLGAAPNKKT